MKISKLLCVAVLCLTPLLAFPIGRSGNGKMAGLEDGFTTEIPPQFPEVDSNQDGSVRLLNPNVITSTGAPLMVYAHRFAVFYPTRASMDRDTLKLEFAANGWKAAALPSDPCVDLYASDRGSASAVVAVWGIGKGVVFVGEKSAQTTRSIEAMVKALILQPGACTWK